MNGFIEFLKVYWFQLSTAIFAVIEIILIVIKRKPKSVDDFRLAVSEALTFIPEFVKKVEKPGNGEAKKNRVIEASIIYVSDFLKRKLTDYEKDTVISLVSDKIETVLSTPVKKGLNNEK